MKDGSVKRFLAPQNCEQCPDAPAGRHCYTRFNCINYDGTVFVNTDAIAENAATYQGNWDRDVSELKRLMGVA